MTNRAQTGDGFCTHFSLICNVVIKNPSNFDSISYPKGRNPTWTVPLHYLLMAWYVHCRIWVTLRHRPISWTQLSSGTSVGIHWVARDAITQ